MIFADMVDVSRMYAETLAENAVLVGVLVLAAIGLSIASVKLLSRLKDQAGGRPARHGSLRRRGEDDGEGVN